MSWSQEFSNGMLPFGEVPPEAEIEAVLDGIGATGPIVSAPFTRQAEGAEKFFAEWMRLLRRTF